MKLPKTGCIVCHKPVRKDQLHYHWYEGNKVVHLSCTDYTVWQFEVHQYWSKIHYLFRKHMQRGHNHAQHPEDFSTFRDDNIVQILAENRSTIHDKLAFD